MIKFRILSFIIIFRYTFADPLVVAIILVVVYIVVVVVAEVSPTKIRPRNMAS